jgi:hypothetical protein
MARISRRSADNTLDHTAEVARLEQQHQTLEQDLRALDAHLYLTAEERLTRKRIQKQKLVLKDQMYALRRGLR